MRSIRTHRPADHVTPELSAERIDRMWRAIETPPRRAKGPRVALAAVAAVVVVVSGLRLYRGHHGPIGGAPLLARGDVIDAASGSSLTLPDGSSIFVSASTKLSVADASSTRVRLELERGAVTCDVTHVEGRSFEVAAGDIVVRVRGTRFTVSRPDGYLPRHAGSVQVRVERGRVEVARGDDGDQRVMASLGPGQSWSQEEVAPEPPALDPADAPAPGAGAPTVHAARLTAPGHRGGRVPSAGLDRVAESSADLLRRANEARMAAKPDEAARLYNQLREEYPEDARAGLASFELARIRLDDLSDPAGALEALRFAEAHGHGGFMAEDAQALEIDALDRLGKKADCRRMRAAFVASHATSPHLARVLRACGE
jgi:hypothetical protein